MGADQFLLTWNNHKANFASVFSELRLQGQLVDVTLLCDGGSFPAHRLVLAACSPYFASLFSTLDSSHPLIFLRDVRQAELEALLEFIYRGQVSVANSELGGLIKIAESLRIKGLGDVSQRDPASSPPPPPPPPPPASTPQYHSHQRHHHHHHNTNAQYTSLSKHNKRSVSPNTDTNNSYNNTSNGNTHGNSSRVKKAARRCYPAPSAHTAPTSHVPPMDDSIKAAAAAGVFLPDLTTALLTAANSYTHGLAVNFPALAAVSAAAAAEYTRQSGVAESAKAAAAMEDGLKLRWCLEKGREQQQPLLQKMKVEHDTAEMSQDGDGSSTNSELGSPGQQMPTAAVNPIASACKVEDNLNHQNNNTNCNDSSAALLQLYQQQRNGGGTAATSAAAALPSDVSSLLSTYHQLLSSAANCTSDQSPPPPPPPPPPATSSNTPTVTTTSSSSSNNNNSSSSSSSSSNTNGSNTSQQHQSVVSSVAGVVAAVLEDGGGGGSFPAVTASSASLIPTTIHDVQGQAKDAKCLTCQLCGATIKHTANFRRHMKQHLNPRRFPCPWCTAAFGRKDNLKTHTRKHHPGEVEAQEGGVGVSSSGATSATEAEVAAAFTESTAAATPLTLPSQEDKENAELNIDSLNDDDELIDDCDDEYKRDDEEPGEDEEPPRDEDSLVIDEEDEDDDCEDDCEEEE